MEGMDYLMKYRELIIKLFVIFCFFLVFEVAIWAPFFSYYSTSYFTRPKIISSYGYELNDDQFDRILKYDIWSADLGNYGLSTARSLKLAKRDGIEVDGKQFLFHPFNINHLESGNSSWLLSVHSLIFVKSAVSAYSETNDISHLRYAIDYLYDYVDYENNNKYETGFLFNDHAVSARVFALNMLWRYYRSSSLKTKENTELILNYIFELNDRLLSSKFYNYRTNHGTMQCIALLLSATVFSDVPISEKWKKVGVERIEEQLEYLVSQEGFVLEHSFGYQLFMIKLLGAAQKYGDLDSSIYSSSIDVILNRLRDLFNKMIRSDQSIPIIGDTSAGWHYGDSLISGQMSSASDFIDIYQESGILLKQQVFKEAVCRVDPKNSYFLTLFWSNYGNYGHKHWDDMSLDYWACGSQWWRNIGYVPYWHQKRGSAVRWDGSNAPHVAGESTPDSASSRLISSLDSNDVAYFQFKRNVDSMRISIYREVFKVNNIFIVNDYVESDNPHEGEYELKVNWTMDHGKLLKDIDKHEFTFSSGQGEEFLSNFYCGEECSVGVVQGSADSSLGWVEYRGRMRPTTTIQVKSSGAGPSLTHIGMVSPRNNEKEFELLYLPKIYNSGSFDFSLKAGSDSYQFLKDNNKLIIYKNDQISEYEISKNLGKFKSRISEIDNKYNNALLKYGKRFQPLIKYRIKVAYLGAMLLLFSYVVLIVSSAVFSRGINTVLYHLSIACWVLSVFWVRYIYLG